jgi:hypothetical protein
LIGIHIGSRSPPRSAAWGGSKPGRQKAGHFDKKARELIALAVAIKLTLRRLHHGAYRLLENGALPRERSSKKRKLGESISPFDPFVGHWPNRTASTKLKVELVRGPLTPRWRFLVPKSYKYGDEDGAQKAVEANSKRGECSPELVSRGDLRCCDAAAGDASRKTMCASVSDL